MKLKVIIFLFFSLCHFKIAFQYILKISPHLGPLAMLSKDILTCFYIIVGIIGISIKIIYKIKYDRIVYLLSCITILYSIFILTIHSYYYYNVGALPIYINPRNINPITYYTNLAKYPPPISSIYFIIGYNIIVSFLIYYIRKKQSSK